MASNTTAFTTSFTGRRVSPTQKAAVRPSISTRRPPNAVLGSKTANSPWTQAGQKRKYNVKVMQNDRCTVVEVDAETDLRKALLDAKVDLYTLKGKITNCGGGGSCGTCVVAVEEGVYSVGGRTPKEDRMLKGKPSNWKLACRTTLTGDCTIRTKPKA